MREIITIAWGCLSELLKNRRFSEIRPIQQKLPFPDYMCLNIGKLNLKHAHKYNLLNPIFKKGWHK